MLQLLHRLATGRNVLLLLALNLGCGEFCCYVDLVKVDGEWKIYGRS